MYHYPNKLQQMYVRQNTMITAVELKYGANTSH